MKALSLKQPFAELILQGRKTIELRKWNTHFRGDFLIHASKQADQAAMKQFGFDVLPCGFIVGKATLADVKEYGSEKEFDEDKEKHLASREWGMYGFILKNVERCRPTAAKGKLNFWEYHNTSTR